MLKLRCSHCAGVFCGTKCDCKCHTKDWIKN